jgi:hypothetical protein
MSRYTNVNIINKVGRGNVYDSNVLPYIEPNDSDILIMTTAEDRLDLLANHYFGDATLWWVIALKNNITDIDLKLQPGTQLRIPSNVSSITNLL